MDSHVLGSSRWPTKLDCALGISTAILYVVQPGDSGNITLRDQLVYANFHFPYALPQVASKLEIFPFPSGDSSSSMIAYPLNGSYPNQYGSTLFQLTMFVMCFLCFDPGITFLLDGIFVPRLFLLWNGPYTVMVQIIVYMEIFFTRRCY